MSASAGPSATGVAWTEGPTASRVAVLSRSWIAIARAGWSAPQPPETLELAAAVRSLSGALSRCSAVDVLVPGGAGLGGADGAFDRVEIGLPAGGSRWPEAAAARFEPSGSCSAALVDDGDGEAVALARALMPGVPVLAVGRAHGTGVTEEPGRLGPGPAVTGVLDVGAAVAPVAPDAAGAPDATGEGLSEAPCHRVGLYARVHPYAASRAHHELGAVAGYLLVLSDRAGAGAPDAKARWLLARCARRHVVVVEGAVAHVWRSRSELFAFEVHSRMDLWRLMAHAWAVADLAPGPVYGRECVEAMRYGVPVVAPEGSAVEPLARVGALATFSGTAGLVRRVGSLEEPAARSRLASTGRSVADRWYGDPVALVDRLAGVLAALAAR